jgi:hypothetical protein
VSSPPSPHNYTSSLHVIPLSHTFCEDTCLSAWSRPCLCKAYAVYALFIAMIPFYCFSRFFFSNPIYTVHIRRVAAEISARTRGVGRSSQFPAEISHPEWKPWSVIGSDTRSRGDTGPALQDHRLSVARGRGWINQSLPGNPLAAKAVQHLFWYFFAYVIICLAAPLFVQKC